MLWENEHCEKMDIGICHKIGHCKNPVTSFWDKLGRINIFWETFLMVEGDRKDTLRLNIFERFAWRQLVRRHVAHSPYLLYLFSSTLYNQDNIKMCCSIYLDSALLLVVNLIVIRPESNHVVAQWNSIVGIRSFSSLQT